MKASIALSILTTISSLSSANAAPRESAQDTSAILTELLSTKMDNLPVTLTDEISDALQPCHNNPGLSHATVKQCLADRNVDLDTLQAKVRAASGITPAELGLINTYAGEANAFAASVVMASHSTGQDPGAAYGGLSPASGAGHPPAPLTGAERCKKERLVHCLLCPLVWFECYYCSKYKDKTDCTGHA